MKKITLISLFFCLAITTVLAQSTTNIATPNSSGLSDNQVVSFDVNSDGTILNNSAADGTAQLGGTAVTANSNITTGSEANLILFQVTGTTVSDLDGTIEVFGTEAGLIIANPNGITCAGCGFINADRVDLVTGTYNIATGTYSISDNDFTIDNGGLLARNVGVLNIQTNNFTNNDVDLGVSADTFNLSVAGDFDNEEIETNTFNLSLAGDFNQRQHVAIEANTFNLSIAGDFDKIVNYINSQFITNSNGRIEVNAFNLNVDGDFTFSNSTNNLDWRANDTLTVSGTANITAADFNNSGTINVTNNNFNATVGEFINQAGATITAIGECNLVATTSYTDNGTITCQDVVLETMVIDIVAPVDGLSDNQVEDFDVNTYYGTILNNSASGGTAQLRGTAVTANGNITAGSEASLILFQVTGSTVSDLYGTIEVFGTEAGIIIANPNGIVCGSCGFINADRVDLVTGTYDTATETYSISDNDFTIDSDGLLANTVGVLNIQTNNFTNNDNSPGVSADTFNLSVAGDFSNKDTAINVNNTFNLSVAGDFSNSAAGIYADTFNLSIDGDFVHDRNALIQVNTFNLSIDGDFDDIVNYQNTNFITTNNGQIKVNALNLNVGGDFTFSESANDFIWRANDTLTVSGTANITAASFNNSGTIDVDNSFNINAASFNNSGFITVTNNSFNASVDTFINQAGATISAFGNCNIVSNSYTDDGTITCQDVVLNEAIVIDIATPVDGFSNNSVEDFDVNSEGTILNNSAGDGTALGTAVTGNDNITAGSEASLILLQVTGSTVSDLGGTIEVFGTEAGLIIANPNGIVCNACAFINANRLDLVTGNNYNASTNRFGSIAAADIDIASSGLDASSVGILNIQTGRDFSNSAEINANNLNITAGADFNNAGSINTDNLNITAGADFNNSATINNTDTVTIEVTNFANDITNTSTVSSASLNFILTANFTHSSTSFSGFNFSNLAISTDGTFTNNATINSTGNTAITANTFNNTGGVVNADTFALSVAGNFDYANKGTITTNTFNLNVGGNFTYNNSANDFSWGANDNLTVTGNANITTNNYTQSGAIDVVGDWTINAASDFLYNRPNNNFIWDTNDSLTVSGTASIGVASFANSGTISVNTTLNTTVSNTSSGSFNNTGGEIDAATFNLDVAGDFDFADKGTLTTTAFNLDVAGNFSYDDENTNFVWDANDTLTVSGNASIDAASFNNSGTINVTNIFDITAAADFANSGTINVTISSFDITAANFNNSGTITVTNSSFDITATNFTNTGTGTISANSFNAIVDSFINQSGASITAGECNIVATTSSDNGSITCLNSGGDVDVIDIVSPINKISRNVYTDFNIPINGIVLNNSDSTTTSQLLGGVVQANPNYASGDAASIILAQVSGPNSFLFGALEVVGAEAAVIIANPNGITCNGCSFINASEVDLVTGSSYNSDADSSFDSIANTNIAIIENGLDASSVGILNIHAGSFTNTGGLQANTLNLNVVGDFDYTQRGIINATTFNLEVGGDFSNNDATTGFVWEENDTLKVLGDANITALNFINHGTIDITNSASGSFEITTGYTAINQGSIVSDILTINAADFFRNLTGGDISTDTLNIVAGGKVTNTANITVGTLNIIANDDSSRTNDTTGFYVSNRGNITATTLNIAAVDNFYNRGNITATTFNITRAKSVFFLNREIDSFYAAGHTYDGGDISLDGNSSFIAADGSIENYGNIDLGVFNLDLTANSFTNHEDATIDAATVNLINVNRFIDNGSITATINQ